MDYPAGMKALKAILSLPKRRVESARICLQAALQPPLLAQGDCCFRQFLAPAEVRGAGPSRPPVQVSLSPAPLRAHATEPRAGAASVKGGQPEGLIFVCETWLSDPSPLPTLHTLCESDTCGFGLEPQLY